MLRSIFRRRCYNHNHYNHDTKPDPQLDSQTSAGVSALPARFTNYKALGWASRNLPLSPPSKAKRLWVERGVGLNMQGRYPSNLYTASYSGDEIRVQRLLERGADVNTQGGHFGNALQAASHSGHKAVVQQLLEKGANVNAQGGYFGNALQAASVEGHELVVRLLLEKGADVNAQGGYFGNSLYAASYSGHEAVAQQLLEKGADVNAQGGAVGNALYAASAEGHEAVVRLLLEKGAEIGESLLAALIEGHEAVVRLLLEKRADVNTHTNSLQAESAEGYEELVRRLLEIGAESGYSVVRDVMRQLLDGPEYSNLLLEEDAEYDSPLLDGPEYSDSLLEEDADDSLLEEDAEYDSPLLDGPEYSDSLLEEDAEYDSPLLEDSSWHSDSQLEDGSGYSDSQLEEGAGNGGSRLGALIGGHETAVRPPLDIWGEVNTLGEAEVATVQTSGEQTITTEVLETLYEPLDMTRSEIRLLEILSSTDKESTIKCRLYKMSLLEYPEYAALSYVWGDPTITEDIIVNGVVLPVTTNLAAALRCVPTHGISDRSKERDTPFRLWADAVCINQNDVRERSNQVQLMGTIYQQANLVISWLCPDNDQISFAIEKLVFIARELETKEAKQSGLEWMRKFPDLCDSEEDEESDSFHLHNKTWNAISKLFKLRYWTRVWTFQEMALAKTLRFACGTHSIDYGKMSIVTDWLENLEDMLLIQPEFLSNGVWRAFRTNGILSWVVVQRISHARDTFRDDTKYAWIRRQTYFLMASSFLVTDPRDRIYGLLGITHSTVVPDYSKSVREVYCEFTETWMKELQSMIFLSMAGIGFGSENKFGLPSWTPNYQDLRFSVSSSRNYHGLGDLIKDQSYIQDLKLNAYGIRIGAISRAETSLDLHSFLDGRLLEYFQDFISRTNMYTSGIPPLQAIFRTFFLDQDPRSDDWIDPDRPPHMLAFGFLQSMVSSPTLEISHINRFPLLGLPTDGDYSQIYTERFWPSMTARVPLSARDLQEIDSEIIGSCQSSVQHFIEILAGHRFFETSDGYLGLGPQGIVPGDLICTLNGFDSPLVIRRANSHCILVGECFVLGLVRGEAKHFLQDSKVEVEKLSIIARGRKPPVQYDDNYIGDRPKQQQSARGVEWSKKG
ncbi:hypothetical protein FGG08_000748 [Glutinoglossum americanum]|uniref:Heterokaryon incompatibility domain-containing protein n=1 Tax=Glutinoglossum americanum TaxID=1670608 RepID=A0A9P8IER5_9PEZI|nr:hypothetical protein FGG08_000748 [Glutinoglossum americanum]